MLRVRSTTPRARRPRHSINLLGAILAGGQSTRFGSDKAHAFFDGARLIDRVADALGSQTTAIVVCGREEPGFGCVPDQPEAGLGPLGGLNAALVFAETHGFAHVLSAGVDCPNLPPDLSRQLSGKGATVVASQPVVGLWPVSVSGDLADFIGDGGRSLYGFVDHVDARQITLDPPLLNVNRPEDLL